MSADQQRTVHGPFHRLAAPDVQDAETVGRQTLSGEIWGKAPRWGGPPRVKADRGQLPADADGVEFWAFARPDNEAGPRAYWQRPGEVLDLGGSLEVVKLKVAFVRITQPLEVAGR